MLRNVQFADATFNLAVWCFKTLEDNGIHHLKGVETLKRNYDRFSQLKLESGEEILLEKTGRDEDAIYRFVFIQKPYIFFSADFFLMN